MSGSIDALFSWVPTHRRRISNAASTLAQAFASDGVAEPIPPEAPAPLQGVPRARAQADELSLDHVFKTTSSSPRSEADSRWILV